MLVAAFRVCQFMVVLRVVVDSRAAGHFIDHSGHFWSSAMAYDPHTRNGSRLICNDTGPECPW